jgi:signal transduction histidine kinase
VNEATAELDTLIKKFIEKDEKERIHIGQNIHDGVGQYLTGMLLQSEALARRLKTADHSETLLAERMIQRIKNCMQTIRNLSRSQIPIHFLEIPLSTALNEMVSYLNAVTSTNLQLNLIGSTRRIPPALAQHLFRIVHETITSAIHTYKAKIVDIQFTTQATCCTISVEVSQMPNQGSDFTFPIPEIVQYRAKIIEGKLELSAPPGSNFCLKCSAYFKEETP